MAVRIISILISISISFSCFPQQYLNLKSYNVDSLRFVLRSQVDEERVNTLNELAAAFCHEEFDSCARYAEEAMNLAKTLNLQDGIAAAYRSFGHINYYKGNYSEALTNFLESLRLYEELDRKHTVADLYFDIGATHYYASNFEKSLEYGNISLSKFRERLEDGSKVGGVRDTVKVIGGLGMVHAALGDQRKMLDIILKILEVGKMNQFSNTEMMLQTFIAGCDYLAVGELDSARAYFLRSLSYPDETPSIEALKYRPIWYLGWMHYREQEYDSAIIYYQKAYDWFNKNGFIYWATDACIDVGDCYFHMKDYVSAEKYYLEGEKLFSEMQERQSHYRYDSLKYVVSYGTELYVPIPISRRIEMIVGYEWYMYERFYELYSAINDTEKALQYHIAYTDAKDRFNEMRMNREAVELQTRYESDQKEKQIEHLTTENSFNEYKLRQTRYFLFGLIGLVILIAVLALVIVRMNKLSNEQNNLLLRQKLFRAQMNPHFLFNTLVSIQNFIINEEPVKAGKYLSKFSKLVRNILDGSFEEYISLEEEVNTLENYLELQKIRYPEKFNYRIEMDESIDPETTRFPPMLLQPFIENCIEHGFKHKESKGNIEISFSLKNSSLLVEVIDDGIGREQAKLILKDQNLDHKSLATSITEERIHILNKITKKKISLEILDLRNDTDEANGTKVILKIPFK